MNNSIYNVINMGAPIFSNISISFDELRSIADNPEILEQNIEKIKSHIWSKVHYNSKLAFHRIDKVDDESLLSGKIEKCHINGIIISTSSEDSVSHILLNPFDYFLELQSILNLDGKKTKYFYDEDVIKRMNERINVLEKISSFQELKNEFPELYSDYQKGEILYKKLDDFKDTWDENTINNLSERYKRCGLKHYLYYFVKKQAFIYRRIVNNFSEFVNICVDDEDRDVKNETINNTDYLSGVDSNKLSLLICYKYIQKALKANSFDSYQTALFYILPFLSNNNMRTISIYIDGIIVNYEYIKKEYIRMNKKFNDLVPYNTNRRIFIGKTKEESLKKIDYELNLYHKFKRESHIGGSKGKIEYMGGSSEPRDDQLLNELYERKIKLLETDEYMEKFLTQFGFDGYIYFVYPNGIILREKYFSNFSHYILADNEAMYKSDIGNFFDIHNMSKNDLIHLNNDVVRRIYHNDTFEDRAHKFIEMPYTNDDVKLCEEFIAKVRKRELLIPTKNKKIF